MKEFEVYIEETCCQKFIVMAKDMEEAEEIAMEKYDEGEFVLEPGELTSKCIMTRDTETDEETNWMEF